RKRQCLRTLCREEPDNVPFRENAADLPILIGNHHRADIVLGKDGQCLLQGSVHMYGDYVPALAFAHGLDRHSMTLQLQPLPRMHRGLKAAFLQVPSNYACTADGRSNSMIPTSPARKPPICASQAIDALFSGVSRPSPAIRLTTNHTPRKTTVLLCPAIS